MNKLKIAVIIGSVRQNRFSEKTAKWIFELAKKKEADVELLDLKDYPMPFLEDATPPSMVKDGNYSNPVVKKWAHKVKEFDAFILATPEYNHSTSGVLKNAIDQIFSEWNNKAIAFISHGSAAGGSRAVEHLRQISIELQMAPIRTGVHISNYWTGMDEKGTFNFAPYEQAAEGMIMQLLWWGHALKAARAEKK